eukprot:TRINITY_DN4887_c2_g1_i1.p1 TRINITY_DN4887_c2_g1~~TRINITY_DN4887_c2_g1_i1.p1  ORF type:complete len:169 (-),score=41.76 TRINITY_DN4887_c2_g1_i1:3-509(-)
MGLLFDDGIVYGAHEGERYQFRDPGTFLIGQVYTSDNYDGPTGFSIDELILSIVFVPKKTRPSDVPTSPKTVALEAKPKDPNLQVEFNLNNNFTVVLLLQTITGQSWSAFEFEDTKTPDLGCLSVSFQWTAARLEMIPLDDHLMVRIVHDKRPERTTKYRTYVASVAT